MCDIVETCDRGCESEDEHDEALQRGISQSTQ